MFSISFVALISSSIGIKTGRGYLQHPDDSDVDLPGEDPHAFNALQTGCMWSVKLFRSTCTHAVLLSSIYRELYATKAFYKSFPEVCKTVTKLSDQLRDWKREYSCLSYTPPKSKESKDLNRDEEVKIVAHISEKLGYLNSIILINRMPLLFEIAALKRTYPSRDASKHVSATSRHHSLICLHAARDSLKLLDRLPWRDIGFSWWVDPMICFDFFENNQEIGHSWISYSTRHRSYSRILLRSLLCPKLDLLKRIWAC